MQSANLHIIWCFRISYRWSRIRNAEKPSVTEKMTPLSLRKPLVNINIWYEKVYSSLFDQWIKQWLIVSKVRQSQTPWNRLYWFTLVCVAANADLTTKKLNFPILTFESDGLVNYTVKPYTFLDFINFELWKQGKLFFCTRPNIAEICIYTGCPKKCILFNC